MKRFLSVLSAFLILLIAAGTVLADPLELDTDLADTLVIPYDPDNPSAILIATRMFPKMNRMQAGSTRSMRIRFTRWKPIFISWQTDISIPAKAFQ